MHLFIQTENILSVQNTNLHFKTSIFTLWHNSFSKESCGLIECILLPHFVGKKSYFHELKNLKLQHSLKSEKGLIYSVN